MLLAREQVLHEGGYAPAQPVKVAKRGFFDVVAFVEFDARGYFVLVHIDATFKVQLWSIVAINLICFMWMIFPAEINSSKVFFTQKVKFPLK